MSQNNTQVIEKHQLTVDLKMFVSVTLDEQQLYLDVDYMNGKYKIQKSFSNNYIGLELLSESKLKFETEESVREYLGI